DALMGGELDLSTVEGLEEAGQRVIDIFAGLTNLTSGFIDGLRPLFRALGEIAERFADMDEKGQDFSGTILGLSQSVNTAFSALDAFKGVLTAFLGISVAKTVGGWAVSIGKIAPAAAKAIGGSTTGLTGLAAAAGYGAGTLINKYVPGVDTAAQKTWGFVDSLIDFTGTQESALESLGDMIFSLDEIGKGAGLTTEEVAKLEGEIQNLKDMTDDVIRMNMELSGEPLTQSDWSDIETETRKQFKQAGLDTSVLSFKMNADTDNAVKKIDDLPPKIEKLDPDPVEVPIEIQEAEIEKEIAELESQAEVAQAAFEYRAKVETAEIEKFQTALEEAGATARDAKQATTDMVDVWAGGVEGPFENLKQQKLWRLIEDRMDMEKESHRLQQEMKKEQLKLMELRREQMEEGESAMNVTIDDSVEPALRLVMMNILELMQTELNQYADQFLTGINSVTQ
ncbi:MAG: hypothetical protein ACLFRO_05095, partial [Desulfobacterales bacterium]